MRARREGGRGMAEEVGEGPDSLEVEELKDRGRVEGLPAYTVCGYLLVNCTPLRLWRGAVAATEHARTGADPIVALEVDGRHPSGDKNSMTVDVGPSPEETCDVRYGVLKRSAWPSEVCAKIWVSPSGSSVRPLSGEADRIGAGRQRTFKARQHRSPWHCHSLIRSTIKTTCPATQAWHRARPRFPYSHPACSYLYHAASSADKGARHRELPRIPQTALLPLSPTAASQYSGSAAALPRHALSGSAAV